LASDVRSSLVIIAGGSGSGKTTFAQKLSSSLGQERSTIVELDCYYRPLSHLSLEERARVNFDAPEALDFELLLSHVSSLLKGVAVESPIYDYAVHDRKKESQILPPRDFIILEGVLALHTPELRALSAYRLFIETADQIRFARRAARDQVQRQRTLASIKEQWYASVLPMHRQHCEAGKIFADMILSGESEFEVQIEKVKSLLLNSGTL